MIHFYVYVIYCNCVTSIANIFFIFISDNRTSFSIIIVVKKNNEFFIMICYNKLVDKQRHKKELTIFEFRLLLKIWKILISIRQK